MKSLSESLKLFLCGMSVLLFLLTGCSTGSEYVVHRLDVRQTGWDTLDIKVTFAARHLLGRNQPIQPETLQVLLYNAAYDTLYAGADLHVPVPDAELGNKERLMLEVCGVFQTRTVCEQQPVTASAKRLLLEHDLAYPQPGSYDRGRFDLRFVTERQRYGVEGWERIRPRDRIEGYLLAFVGDEMREGVKIPFSRSQGHFDLTRYDHYDDFAYFLKSELLDEKEAQIRFDVYAALQGEQPSRLASIEKQIREKTDDDRLLEVQFFTEQAAAQVLDHLEVTEEEREATAYIDGWDFNRLTGLYRVELEIEWRTGGRFFGRRYQMQGVLEVKEDGSDAHFARQDLSRWASRWDDEADFTFALQNLDPYDHLAAQADSTLQAELAGN